jgi:hypothetical protein
MSWLTSFGQHTKWKLNRWLASGVTDVGTSVTPVLLERLDDYTANLCAFYFYKFIGNLTTLLQVQAFNLRNLPVDSSTTAARRLPRSLSTFFRRSRVGVEYCWWFSQSLYQSFFGIYAVFHSRYIKVFSGFMLQVRFLHRHSYIGLVFSSRFTLRKRKKIVLHHSSSGVKAPWASSLTSSSTCNTICALMESKTHHFRSKWRWCVPWKGTKIALPRTDSAYVDKLYRLTVHHSSNVTFFSLALLFCCNKIIL